MANTGTRYLPGGGTGKVPQFFGVYVGYVSINIDPLGQGRCRLRVPQVLGQSATHFAAPLIAGTPVPAIGDSVSVMFLGGDPTQPTWIGPVASTVTSVFGRLGVVAATSGDYTVAQVTGAAPIASPIFTGAVTSTGGTASAPTVLQTDTWHTMGAFDTNFSHGTPAPSVKLNVDDTVSMAGQIVVASGTTSGTVVALPTGYIPISVKKFSVPVSAGTPATVANVQITLNPASGSPASSMILSAGPTGSLYDINIDGIRYPLDF